MKKGIPSSNSTNAGGQGLGTPAATSDQTWLWVGNGCEIEVTVLPQGVTAIAGDLEFDLKRTKTGSIRHKTLNPPNWYVIESFEDEGDDSTEKDEDNTMSTNRKIYSVDYPYIKYPQSLISSSPILDEVVQQANFSEFVEVTIKLNAVVRISETYAWQSKSRVKIDRTGNHPTWSREGGTGDNFIKVGHMTSP